MSQPGAFANGVPAGEDWVPRAIRDLQREVQQLRAERSLESASVGGGGMQSGNFDGNLQTGAVGTEGWGLGGPDGQYAIFNNIVLRGGIVGNDALANPIDASYSQESIAGVGFSTTPDTVVSSYTLVKPPGFTRGILNFGIRVGAQNTSAVSDVLYVAATINDTDAGEIYKPFDAGESDVALYYAATIVYAAVGDTSVTLQARAWTGGGDWSSVSTNGVDSTCAAIWLH